MTDLDLADVQGLLLRGYGMNVARVLVLRVADVPAARRFLGGITGADPSLSQVTTAAPWPAKPDATLNIALTYRGLAALGLPADSLASFPDEFRAPLPERAARTGDTGDNAPANWVGGLAWTDAAPSEAHVLLLLFAVDAPAREAATARLRAGFAPGLAELSCHDGAELPESRVHFGYVDGLSQPRIEGALPAGTPDDPDFRDDQPPAPTGEFLLGYTNQYGYQYPLPQPPDLGRNGTFVALRILQQDVDGFEKFLEANAASVPAPPGADPKEYLAAKLIGRWRNGVPLALSPDTDQPNPPLPLEQINCFDYVPSADYPDVYDDHRGYRCPIGAHMRRVNPRGGMVAGGGNHLHRAIRRGIPYGPVYDPARPHDGVERGLIGLFLCASLKEQFEFLMSEWVNGDSFGLGGDRDLLAGNNQPEHSRFVLRREDDPQHPVVLSGFGRFVTTRGGAYGFLPSLTALRFLSQLA